MTRERRYGLLVMVPLAVASTYMLYSGVAALIGFAAHVAARNATVIANSGDVAVVPAALAMIAMALVELLQPDERWRTRLFGSALVFFAGMIVLPVAFMLAAGPTLAAHGYARCPQRVIGYTLPAARYALGEADCATASRA